MDRGEGEVLPTIQERIAAEERVRERVDEEGNRWTKVYFGGGEHFRNWLEQCRELGEVMVEPVDATGYRCFEQGGEALYRIWMKTDQTISASGLQEGQSDQTEILQRTNIEHRTSNIE